MLSNTALTRKINKSPGVSIRKLSKEIFLLISHEFEPSLFCQQRSELFYRYFAGILGSRLFLRCRLVISESLTQ